MHFNQEPSKSEITMFYIALFLSCYIFWLAFKSSSCVGGHNSKLVLNMSKILVKTALPCEEIIDKYSITKSFISSIIN